MKKIIKRKLFNQNGLSKNYFLWEISNEYGIVYEIIEEFKGHSIARSKLKGIFNNRLKALDSFRKTIIAEMPVQKTSHHMHRLVLG